MEKSMEKKLHIMNSVRFEEQTIFID